MGRCGGSLGAGKGRLWLWPVGVGVWEPALPAPRSSPDEAAKSSRGPLPADAGSQLVGGHLSTEEEAAWVWDSWGGPAQAATLHCAQKRCR